MAHTSIDVSVDLFILRTHIALAGIKTFVLPSVAFEMSPCRSDGAWCIKGGRRRGARRQDGHVDYSMFSPTFPSTGNSFCCPSPTLQLHSTVGAPANFVGFIKHIHEGKTGVVAAEEEERTFVKRKTHV